MLQNKKEGATWEWGKWLYNFCSG